jgi:putative transposase
MSRVARVVVPGFPHHVTQRGNRKADIFLTEDDRHAYLRLLNTYAREYGLHIWAYCLMTNHLHLVVVPEREESLSKTLHDAHTVYAMRFNTRHEQTGHLWQGRFYSCVMDEPHSWAAVRYVELNPVRAGMIARANAYPWSSAAAHCGMRTDYVLTKNFPPPDIVHDWSEWLQVGESDETMDRLRRHTHTGRPCGSPRFLTQIETRLGRSLRGQKRGRKPAPAQAT